MCREYENAVFKYNAVVNEFIRKGMLKSVSKWKRFRHTSIKISPCYNNRWFIIVDVNKSLITVIAIIDDMEGYFIISRSDGYRGEVLNKMYTLPGEVSYEAYNYSKCGRCVVL